ncbi:PREDICTED: muscular LMNA-interacting protein isoform X2 [Crocodylus porosus]|uniref:muscular LMNA-interacting protein isoform X2 n=1 Tax=Crocodylus porosus TaxID=8502 RepID=UPI00093E9907|nr:PREDICTED: muscular LMNA-interacting protein isoform X2 [Crocodylus porosus]
MELGKHEKEIPAKETLKEKLTLHATYGQRTEERDLHVASPLKFLNTEQVPSGESGSKPLTFTFVPYIGQLPSHFEVVDASKFLVKISEKPNADTRQEIINKSHIPSGDLAFKNQFQQDSKSTFHPESTQKIFQPQEHNTGKRKMQENDLFKAEFIFITDSGEEDEETIARNKVQPPSVGSYGHTIFQSSNTSLDPTASNKPFSDMNAPRSQGAALSHSSTAQLTSLSTSDHLFHKPPAIRLISPTNLKVKRDLVNLNQASSLEESYNKCQSATGSSKQDSSTCFQATTHSSPISKSKRSDYELSSPSSSSQFLGSSQVPTISIPDWVYKPSQVTRSGLPNGSGGLSSDVPSSSKIQDLSAQSLPSCSFKRSVSAIPVHVTAHLLSPSPKPLSSPFYSSSSTICSINEPYSQMSPTGNQLKPEIRASLPTRLTFLTAVLKAHPSQQRPLSPASCPATFSVNSLGSSTLSVDQKFITTPPTPKKYVSGFSVRSDSPSQEEHQPLGFSHVPLSSKAHHPPRARSLSPRNHLYARPLSPDSLSPLSSTVSSYRKTVVSPLLQPSLPTYSMPSCVPRHSSLNPESSSTKQMHYPISKSQIPEKSRRVHTYSPTLICKSHPLSSPSNQRGTFPPSFERCSSPSPNPLNSTYKSKASSAQRFAQEFGDASPALSNASMQLSSSRPNSTSPVPSACYSHPRSSKLSSSSLHPSYRVYSSPLRPEQSATPSVAQCRSPVSDWSPCPLLSRSRELTSPQTFSLSSDHENTKAKQYKIKTSYKAFAAIPTNTLLMEQKALEEPTKKASETELTTLDTHSEMCSPAQLRQQTEELCATIDQVLQDPLPMRRCESSPSFLQTPMDSDTGKMSTVPQRTAGRETKYANLYLSAPGMTESQLTKPGVIRPAPVKTKILLKKEEPYQPNPFKKYLEESRDPDVEQPSHPIVPIPENEALSSKELHSATAQNKSNLLPTHESKETSKGKFPEPENTLYSERFIPAEEQKDTALKST